MVLYGTVPPFLDPGIPIDCSHICFLSPLSLVTSGSCHLFFFISWRYHRETPSTALFDTAPPHAAVFEDTDSS